MKTKLLLLLVVFTISINAQTFNWEGGTSINGGGSYVRQTVAGVQAECTNSSNDLQHLDGGGFAGSSGYIVSCGPNTTSLTVTFDTVINVQSIYAFDGNASALDDWTFTPAGGTNSNVVQSVGGSTGVTVNTNWTNVTAFTITSANGFDRFSIDDIVFSIAPCSDVNIPDANFKAYLIGNTVINTNGDAEIQCSEATAFTGIINCSYLSISDLTGIEAFVNLTELYTQYNSLTSLDVSTNTNLVRLACDNNNSLTNLNVSGASSLELLWCNSTNSLTSLDVSGATSLEHLYSYDGALTNLNVTGANVLETLIIYNNSISNLDVSTNTALRYLTCNDNSIISLDTSVNTNLRELFCQNNALTSLNLANGNNTSITDFNATSNPTLACIEVDNVAYSDSNWPNKDTTALYSTDCSSALGINDFHFNESQIQLYPNPTNSILNIEMDSDLKQVTIYSVLGTQVLKTTSKTIKTSTLISGMYLIKIEDKNGFISIKRFVKN
jgi:hypothetical protein